MATADRYKIINVNINCSAGPALWFPYWHWHGSTPLKHFNLHIHNISISTWKPWWFTHFTLFLVHFLFSCEHFFTLIGPHTPPFLWRREPYSKLLKYPPILLSTLKKFFSLIQFQQFWKVISKFLLPSKVCFYD